MKNTKLSLQDLIESKVDTLKEDEFDQRAGYEYKIKIGDNRYKLVYGVNKNPTKIGIKVKFFPLDKNGNEILNPSDELLAQMQNDISTRLSPKFN